MCVSGCRSVQSVCENQYKTTGLIFNLNLYLISCVQCGEGLVRGNDDALQRAPAFPLCMLVLFK